MRVVQINTSDHFGGAAVAAYRLHTSLLAMQVDAHLIVQSARRREPRIHPPQSKPEKVFAQINPALDKLAIPKVQVPFSSNWKSNPFLRRKLKELDPDIIHVNWVGNGFMSLGDLIGLDRPIVFSMHDQWYYTGGCHYTGSCSRFEDSCGQCPQLSSKRTSDLSAKIYRRKSNAYDRLPRKAFVGPSNWMAKEATRSGLLRESKVVCLPYPIDTQQFRPEDKAQARRILDLDPNRKLILFGAVDPDMDERKGFSLLMEALKALDSTDVACVTFGGPKEWTHNIGGLQVSSLGYLNDETTLKLVYSAADVTVLPSRQENLANIAIESVACGTPVVAFDIGGNSDTILHLKNGYLAKAYEPNDLAHGIIWALENNEEAARNARAHALAYFSSDKVAPKFLELYNSL